MGILTRFKDIISANLNALLDKAEDPAKMIDQYLENVMDNLAEVQSETASVMAEESRCKRLLTRNSEDIAKYESLAKRALQAGHEDDAKTFIAKKQECEASHAQYMKAYTAAHTNANKMRQLHDKLVTDIEALQSRRASIKATMAVANTQQTVNKAMDAYGNASGSLAGFEKMEEKAQRMLDEANAIAELNEDTDSEINELEKKYGSTSSKSVDDELAALKTELGV